MAINFPSSPVNGQTFSASGQNWIYNSSIPAWELDSPFVPGPTGPTGPAGAAGATGPTGPTGTAGDWSSAQTLNAQTGTTYTMQSTDAGKLVTFNNGAAITLTVSTTTALSAGQRIDFVQLGVGQITVSASGVTVNATPGLKTRAQYSTASLICTASNTYVLTGDLSA